MSKGREDLKLKEKKIERRKYSVKGRQEGKKKHKVSEEGMVACENQKKNYGASLQGRYKAR